MEDFNKTVIEEFRANGGKVGNMFAGMNLLLMTTKGAKSGKEYVVPVAYTQDADTYIVIASKGGAPTNPDWYYNLLAHPDITIEVGTKTYRVHATEVTGEERERLYTEQAKQYPTFNEYKEKTTRIIPVFKLEKI